jgi:hypothetical protein
MLGAKQETDMTERAISFVEIWVSENIHAEGYQPDGDLTQATNYAERCLAAAKAAGIPESEITGEFEDLPRFMAAEIEEANDREVKRQVDKDRI